jgi:hypothetical protein
MQHQQLPAQFSQLAALLGFSVTFFPGLATGANLLQRIPISSMAAFALGLTTWLAASSFTKWHKHQMEPLLEEIEMPKPKPAPTRRANLRNSSRRTAGNYRPASIKR